MLITGEPLISAKPSEVTARSIKGGGEVDKQRFETQQSEDSEGLRPHPGRVAKRGVRGCVFALAWGMQMTRRGSRWEVAPEGLGAAGFVRRERVKNPRREGPDPGRGAEPGRCCAEPAELRRGQDPALSASCLATGGGTGRPQDGQRRA